MTCNKLQLPTCIMLVFLRILPRALVVHVHKITSAACIFSFSAVPIIILYWFKVSGSMNSLCSICASTSRIFSTCNQQPFYCPLIQDNPSEPVLSQRRDLLERLQDFISRMSFLSLNLEATVNTVQFITNTITGTRILVWTRTGLGGMSGRLFGCNRLPVL